MDDLFDLADTALGRAGVVIVPILAVLAFGLEASGLLDLAELITSFPLLVYGGASVASVWFGSAAAAWLTREPTECKHPSCGADRFAMLDAPDLSPEEPFAEPSRRFRNRVTTSRSLAEEIRCRGDF